MWRRFPQNNKTAFFSAQEFPRRNSLILAPFEIVLWQLPRARGTCVQTPPAWFPHHPNTSPLANTHCLVFLISESYCMFMWFSNSFVFLSSLAFQCGTACPVWAQLLKYSFWLWLQPQTSGYFWLLWLLRMTEVCREGWETWAAKHTFLRSLFLLAQPERWAPEHI